MVPCPQAEPADQWALMNDLRVPRDVREITSSWLTYALATNRELGGPSVTGFSVETLAGGTGFINQLFRFRLCYAHDFPGLPSTVIAKFPSADPWLEDGLRQVGAEPSGGEVLPGDGRQRPPRDPSRLPWRIGLRHQETVLLMEDMAHARQGDSVAGCSLDEARSCL